MRYGRASRIYVRRNNADVPLYPTGAVEIASDHPSPRLVSEQHRLHTLEVPEHEHPDFCFHLQTGGSPELEWWWNGKNGLESPKPGALILLPPGTRDRLRWAGASDRFVISLEAKFVRAVADEAKAGLDPSFHTHWHLRDEPLRELLAEIGREALDGWALGTLYAEMLGLSLATLLLKRHATTPLKFPVVRGGLSPKAIKSSLEFITDNLHRDLHLTEIAPVVGLSPFHFVRLFKASTGQTPYQYLLEQRLRRAKELLRFGSLPVSEIGADVGFSSHAHFSRSFRKREGITPTAWRRSYST